MLILKIIAVALGLAFALFDWFNYSLARAVAGAAEEPRQTAIRPILQEEAA